MSRAWVMTDAVKQILRDKYATVDDFTVLAKETGASIHSIRAFASHEGLRRARGAHGGYTKITLLQAKQIAEAYNRGLSCRAIKEHFGLSHQGILNVIRKEGGKVRSWKDHQDSIAKILAEVCAA